MQSSSGAQIYQQRLPDGRVVLTDHPLEGARVQRTWDVTREDPVAAARRREQVREEAQVVSERIERRIERQQAQQERTESARLRARLAEMRQESEAERQTSARSVVLYAPGPVAAATSGRGVPGAIEWTEPHVGKPSVGRAPVDRGTITPADRSPPTKKRRHAAEPS